MFSLCEGAQSNEFGRATRELPRLFVKTHQRARCARRIQCGGVKRAKQTQFGSPWRSGPEAYCAKQSQFPAVPGGTGPQRRETIVQNEPNLPGTPIWVPKRILPRLGALSRLALAEQPLRRAAFPGRAKRTQFGPSKNEGQVHRSKEVRSDSPQYEHGKTNPISTTMPVGRSAFPGTRGFKRGCCGGR